MKVLLLLCVVGAAFALHEVKKTCDEAPETGMCRGYFPSWYYDVSTGTCHKFVYGGCQGNGNRYSTEEECLEHCRGFQLSDKSDDEDVCTLPAESGMCLAYMPRFYFDPIEGKCKKFIYGGCQGNGNNFKTEEECEARCGGSARAPVTNICELNFETGLCRGYFPRYYYDQKEGMCKRFIYGGCGGNKNNFEKEEDCRSACGATVARRRLDRSDCEKKADVGLCKAYMPRYYYDQEEGMCKKFIYGGCGGNKNNFESEDECYNKCGALMAPTSCYQEKETGPCRGAFPRYYYNKDSGKCEEFIYGGCQGNDNNFLTEDDCKNTCHA